MIARKVAFPKMYVFVFTGYYKFGHTGVEFHVGIPTVHIFIKNCIVVGAEK